MKDIQIEQDIVESSYFIKILHGNKLRLSDAYVTIMIYQCDENGI